LMREAGKVLSTISHSAGVVMAPRFTTTIFRHIDFIRLSSERVLVVLVAQSGVVQNKIIDVAEPFSQSELEQMSNYLNRTLAGLSIQQVKARIVEEMTKEKSLYDKLLRRALEMSREALQGESEGELLITGASNMLEQPEFADLEKMKRLFRAFEQKSHLVELLDKSLQADGVQIFIGSANEYSAFEGCSLVTSAFSGRGTIGTLGVIGPSRMPYSMVIPIVDYTARLVSQVLSIDND
jgi:heat-inducible transcriptional repressor